MKGGRGRSRSVSADADEMVVLRSNCAVRNALCTQEKKLVRVGLDVSCFVQTFRVVIVPDFKDVSRDTRWCIG